MNATEPEFLTLDEMFEKHDGEEQSAFLADLRRRLLCGNVQARGILAGQRDLTNIPSEAWRTHILRFDLGGCAIAESNADSNVGAAAARLSGSLHVRPYDPNRENSYWLGLLFPRSELASSPTPRGVEKPARAKGGRPPGQGSNAPADAPLIKRMRELKAVNLSLSDTAAARQLVEDAAGFGTQESKINRLVKGFKAKYPS